MHDAFSNDDVHIKTHIEVQKKTQSGESKREVEISMENKIV